MSKAEHDNEVREMSLLLEALAVDGNSPIGEFALNRLREEQPDPTIRSAALRLRTQELIRQNPLRRRTP